MAKAAIVLLADNETPDGTGRMANALTTAREFAEAGDDVRIIFDGAGVKSGLRSQACDREGELPADS